jgi:hypothetical protein
VELLALVALPPSKRVRARARPAPFINWTGVSPRIREAVSIIHASSKLIIGSKQGRGAEALVTLLILLCLIPR